MIHVKTRAPCGNYCDRVRLQPLRGAKMRLTGKVVAMTGGARGITP